MFSVLAFLIVLDASSSPSSLGPDLQSQWDSDDQKRTKELPNSLEEILRRRDDEERRFRAEFVKLPPGEQVRQWKETTDDRFMNHAILGEGAAAVPFLAEIIRDGKNSLRLRHDAMQLLADVDRFVTAADFPIKDFGPRINWPELKVRGDVAGSMPVTGRRIGQEGLAVLHWAANQTSDKELRFHARFFTGLLKEDMRALSLHAQVDRWRRAVAANRGMHGGVVNPDEYLLSTVLFKLLIDQAPESLPPLIDLLAESKNAYVREALIWLFEEIDARRMRLRATRIGQQAIEAARYALLEVGNLKPVYRDQESRQQEWRSLSDQFYQDKAISLRGDLTLWARAFNSLHDEQISLRPVNIYGGVEAPEDMREFLAYLTGVDPYYPSWEYSRLWGSSVDEMVHPRFRVKIDRLYGHWKRFRAEKAPSTPAKPK